MATRAPIDFVTKPFDSKLGRQIFAGGNTTSCLFTTTVYKDDGTAQGESEELIVGVGINAVMFAQDFNVELVRSMGWADIIEPVTHGVANNQVRISKMTDLNRVLAKVGIAPLGMDNLMGPTLNLTLINSAWSAPLFQQNRGPLDKGLPSGNSNGPLGKFTAPLYYWKAHNLHLTSNSLNAQTGQIVMENVSFVATKFTPRPADEATINMYKRAVTMYPQFYSQLNGSAQAFEQYTFQN